MDAGLLAREGLLARSNRPGPLMDYGKAAVQTSLRATCTECENYTTFSVTDADESVVTYQCTADGCDQEVALDIDPQQS